MTYLSASAIARLEAKSLMAANKAMRAGRYGPLLKRGHIAYAALPAVERHVGQRFTPEQIAAAVAGQPGRMLVIERLED